jgi:hypothetical protein
MSVDVCYLLDGFVFSEEIKSFWRLNAQSLRAAGWLAVAIV